MQTGNNMLINGNNNDREYAEKLKKSILTLTKFLQIAMNIKETGFSMFQSNNKFRPIAIWGCNIADIIQTYARVNKYKILEVDCKNNKQLSAVTSLFDKSSKNSFKSNLIYHYLKNDSKTRKILLFNNFHAIYNNQEYSCILKIISDLEFTYSYKDTIDQNTNIIIVFPEEVDIKSNFLFLNLINQMIHYRCFLNLGQKKCNSNFIPVLNIILSTINNKKDDRKVEDVIIATDMYNIVLDFKKKFMFSYYDRNIDNIYRNSGIYGHILLRVDDWDLLVYIFAFAILEEVTDMEVYKMLLMSIGGHNLWDKKIEDYIQENIISLIK